MALWQIVFDPDSIRHSQTSYMIFKWMLCEKFAAGASLMEALEAVNRELLSDISFNLMAVTYGEKIRKCGKDLWTSILSRQPLNEIEMNGKETWPPILLQLIQIYQCISIGSPSTVGIISKSIPLYKTLSLSSMKIESQVMENGLSHFSPSQTPKNLIYGSSCQPHRAIPGWTIVPYSLLMDSIKTKLTSATNT